MECKSQIESIILNYQILNLHGDLYKTGIQAGPTIHTFLFVYFSLHFHENALLSYLFRLKCHVCNEIIKKISPLASLAQISQ